MSSPVQIAGLRGARYVGLTSSRSREGREVIRTIVGPAADCFALEKSLYNGGASSVVTVQQPGNYLATTTARFTFGKGEDPDDEIQEELSIQYSQVPIPIKQHKYFSDLQSGSFAIIDTAVERRERFPVPVDLDGNGQIEDGEGGDLESDPRYVEYYKMRRNGIDDFVPRMPVVRYTIRCSPNYSGLLETDNVGTIFSKEQMISRISDPVLFRVTEPANVYNHNAYGFFSIGWLLDGAVSFDNDGNGILEEVYTWGQFVRKLYTFNFTPPT